MHRDIRVGHGARMVNGGAYGRRLASPVRLSLASRLGGDIDGAWWPRTASLGSELPELVGALLTRLGAVVDISVNWSSLAGALNFDPLRSPGGKPMPGVTISDQRLMIIAGERDGANVLVIPSRTSSGLAMMVLRLAAALPSAPGDMDTETFRTATSIVRSARTASALHRLRTVPRPMPTR